MKLLDERIWALFKCHWKYTLTYWSVFFSFGLCIAFLGPTVLDLRCQTHSSLQQITWVFFSQQFFLLVGSSLGGLFKKTMENKTTLLLIIRPAILRFKLQLGVILVQCLLMIFYTSCVFLFIGTCVLGLCISSVFPSMLAFTEDILDYKGCATTVLVTSASTGEMLLQLFIGSVIDSQGSYSFLLCCTVTSFISFCLFLLFLSVQHHHRNGQTDPSKGTDLKDKPEPGGS
ncbi:major facilitator superfamily domain-containing protein 4A [Gymnodraco acuticeps]|uniref:Major facilitator superfamily domain-containing protein 4A n=1 Tax=Gymnodraco acuticeps TaxID=8218 RepID=A0A6P8VP06_GYMAC|nr:major facilitator superfamily domain-containing protein 4A [Gymnodraco acuticeps]